MVGTKTKELVWGKCLCSECSDNRCPLPNSQSTHPTQEEAGWAELGAKDGGPGSTLLPRPPRSHIPRPLPLGLSASLTSSSPATEALLLKQPQKIGPAWKFLDPECPRGAACPTTVFPTVYLLLDGLGQAMRPNSWTLIYRVTIEASPIGYSIRETREALARVLMGNVV